MLGTVSKWAVLSAPFLKKHNLSKMFPKKIGGNWLLLILVQNYAKKKIKKRHWIKVVSCDVISEPCTVILTYIILCIRTVILFSGHMRSPRYIALNLICWRLLIWAFMSPPLFNTKWRPCVLRSSECQLATGTCVSIFCRKLVFRIEMYRYLIIFFWQHYFYVKYMYINSL